MVELHVLLKINDRLALGLKILMVELHSDKKQIIVELHPYKNRFQQKYLKNKLK